MPISQQTLFSRRNKDCARTSEQEASMSPLTVVCRQIDWADVSHFFVARKAHQMKIAARKRLEGA
jgi:hypothetical protein